MYFLYLDFPELGAKHSEVQIVNNQDCEKKWNKIRNVASQDICVGVLTDECVPGKQSSFHKPHVMFCTVSHYYNTLVPTRCTLQQ